jgi:hypothetical protein
MFRGVGWVRLEMNAITFEEGKHELRSVNSGMVLLEKRITEGDTYFLKVKKALAT